MISILKGRPVKQIIITAVPINLIIYHHIWFIICMGINHTNYY